jgi:hypothetical protein
MKTLTKTLIGASVVTAALLAGLRKTVLAPKSPRKAPVAKPASARAKTSAVDPKQGKSHSSPRRAGVKSATHKRR